MTTPAKDGAGSPLLETRPPVCVPQCGTPCDGQGRCNLYETSVFMYCNGGDGEHPMFCSLACCAAGRPLRPPAASPGMPGASKPQHVCGCSNDPCPACGGGPSGEWSEGSEVVCDDCDAHLEVLDVEKCLGRSRFALMFCEDCDKAGRLTDNDKVYVSDAARHAAADECGCDGRGDSKQRGDYRAASPVAGMPAPEPKPFVECCFCDETRGCAAAGKCAQRESSAQTCVAAPAAPAEPLRGEPGPTRVEVGQRWRESAQPWITWDESAGEPAAEMTLGEAWKADPADVEVQGGSGHWYPFESPNKWQASFLDRARFRRRPQPQPAPQRSRVEEICAEVFEGKYWGALGTLGVGACDRVLREFVNDWWREYDVDGEGRPTMNRTIKQWGLSGDAPGGGRK